LQKKRKAHREQRRRTRESQKFSYCTSFWALTSDPESAVGKLLNAHSITVQQIEAAIQKSGT
jgi:hypothetical protein